MIHLEMCSSCKERGVVDRYGDFAGHGMGGSGVGGGEASFWLPVEWPEGDFGSGSCCPLVWREELEIVGVFC